MVPTTWLNLSGLALLHPKPLEAACFVLQVVRRPGRDRPDVSAFLALFEHKIRDQSRLSLPEVQAIAAYLSTSVPEFSVFSHADAVLKVCARSLLRFVAGSGSQR